MRHTLLTGAIAAGALSLLTVAPASAATTTETTITTHSVVADTVIGVPYDYDQWGDAGPITAAGPVTYPIAAEPYDGDELNDSFATTAKAPDGCTRVVNSFTFAFAQTELPDDDGDLLVVGGIGTGEPLVLNTLDSDSDQVQYAGDGELSVHDRFGVVELPMWSEVKWQAAGEMTLTFAEPVAPADARGFIALSYAYDRFWVVESASFEVTDTCTTEVEVPAVVSPSPEPPVVGAPAAAAPLAETGPELGVAGIAGATLLALGAATLFVARRRTAQ